MGSVSGALVPAVGWILASFVLSMPVSSGSVIIANTAAGKWYLYGGTAQRGGRRARVVRRLRPPHRGTAPMTVDGASYRRAAGQFASGIVGSPPGSATP